VSHQGRREAPAQWLLHDGVGWSDSGMHNEVTACGV